MGLYEIALVILVVGLQEPGNKASVYVRSTAEYRNENKTDFRESGLKLGNLELTPPATRKLPTQTEDHTCPTWFLPVTDGKGNETCKCGDGLDDIVLCSNTTQPVYLHRSYCMSYNQNTSATVVGNCAYSYYHTGMHHSQYFSLPPNVSNLNNSTCQKYHREGQLCGRCNDTFAPPVYSYTLDCVQCLDYDNNWAKYLAVAFLPLTVFFVIVITFRISATSGSMNAFILVSQISSAPGLLRSADISTYCKGHHHSSVYHLKCYSFHTLSSVHGIWNLDFFRLLYKPFCLHPRMTTLQVLALDCAIAVFPLTFIVITYSLVELHNRNCRIVVRLWKPFHACCVRIRNQWNIKTSLIDAFATFILLSCVKFLSVSLDLLVPARLFDIHGKNIGTKYLYYDGTIGYFGKEHLPYAILAIIMLLVFVVFPCLLLCLFPCHCFQRFLVRYRLRSLALTTFMDAFQGCYKDGTNNTRDCRHFAAMYLILLCVFLGSIAVELSWSIIPSTTFILVTFAIIITIVRPYKSPAHNVTNTCLILVFALAATSVVEQYHVLRKSPFERLPEITAITAYSIPPVYGIGLLLYKLLGHRRVVQQALKKLQSLLPCCCRRLAHTDSEDYLPDRMAHPEQYAALLAEPVREEDSTDQEGLPTNMDTY